MPAATVDAVLADALERLRAGHAPDGGLDCVRQVLERALGRERSRELVERLQHAVEPRLFGGLRRAHPGSWPSSCAVRTPSPWHSC